MNATISGTLDRENFFEPCFLRVNRSLKANVAPGRQVVRISCRSGETNVSRLRTKAKKNVKFVPDEEASTIEDGPDGKTIGTTLEALRSKSRAPKRWLGQHYMVNDDITKRTVECADVKPGDLVLEIGPGTGELTQALLDVGCKVVAVEKDHDMKNLCDERFEGLKSIKLFRADVMRWNVREVMEPIILKRRLKLNDPEYRAKVVSNLPFNITTEILQLLLPMGDLFSQITLMLQDDAALRIIDPSPRKNDYRKMNLFVHFFSKPSYHFFVDKRNFLPPPKVDAAVVSFHVKRASEYPQVSSHKAFFSMANSAFIGKRKMLRNSLQHYHSSDAVKEILKSLNIPETARPEELTLEQFLALFNALEACVIESNAMAKAEP